MAETVHTDSELSNPVGRGFYGFANNSKTWTFSNNDVLHAALHTIPHFRLRVVVISAHKCDGLHNICTESHGKIKLTKFHLSYYNLIYIGKSYSKYVKRRVIAQCVIL